MKASSVTVSVPAECSLYPGSGRARHYDFQKIEVKHVDDVVHVALECKVYDHGHVMVFAKWSIDEDEMSANLLQYDARTASYKKNGCDVVWDAFPLQDNFAEIFAAAPESVETVKILPGMEPNPWTSSVFNISFVNDVHGKDTAVKIDLV